jgi:hypothetical protein
VVVNSQVFGPCICGTGRPLVDVMVSVHGDSPAVVSEVVVCVRVVCVNVVVGSVELGPGLPL